MFDQINYVPNKPKQSIDKIVLDEFQLSVLKYYPKSITQEQHNNCRIAWEFWQTIPEEKVIYHLNIYELSNSCGSVCCFGGHLARNNLFGLYMADGVPKLPLGNTVIDTDYCATHLLGAKLAFNPKCAIDNPTLSDHQIVSKRLETLMSLPIVE